MPEPTRDLDAFTPGAGGGFPISSVAKRTGLSVHTIRAWEKRYGVVAPLRTDTQRRVYGTEDVRKLSLLRALVEAGHPISSVANLSLATLEQRLDQSLQEQPARHGPHCEDECKCLSVWNVGVVGSNLLSLFETQSALLTGLDVSQSWETVEAALEAESLEGPLDLLAIETPVLFPDVLERIRELSDRLMARNVILVYGFAQRALLGELHRSSRFTALRSPVNADELRLAARRPWMPPPPPPVRETGLPVPERVFSPERLARLGRLDPGLRCECPQHLACLISSLAAFEAYSASCENRNEEDAALHAYLHQTTAVARRDLEDALIRVLEAEGIQV